ncbi:hypothetical protein G5I_08790 [Acromyrmex echinatior]|uniref:Uncharacterized protein n=1 Tax=Acromyrmex echinatior TaxID=103372 RepID=F4WSF9_ACREC|nr:hypothetical protein G5I_08790 [Acromyrmex echinatior]
MVKDTSEGQRHQPRQIQLSSMRQATKCIFLETEHLVRWNLFEGFFQGVFRPKLNLSEIYVQKPRDEFSVKLSSERAASVVAHYETASSLHSSSLRPRLPSSGICTRANYPSPPLKLQQNLLRRRIGAPRPPVLSVQQPGMPPSTAELVFKRRPRLERVATLRAPRPRVLLLHPFAYPRSPSILRYTNSAQCFAMERELASSSPSFSSSSSACLTSPCPVCLAHSDSTERGPASDVTAEERAREVRTEERRE